MFALLLFVAVVILMVAAGLAFYSAAKIFEKTRTERYRRTR